MKLKVDVIVNPVLFEEEDTGLVELAIVASRRRMRINTPSSVPVVLRRM
ncbi:hypothetical protein QUA70_25820 [Microcoleus sp. LAD1_D5]